jgi:alpha-1,3-fucosyltransferase
MNDYIIPVVYSGADLTRFLPPKSYVDANAFKTVEELANHLKYLSNNPQEYVKHFWWKKYYKFILRATHNQERICDILNLPSTYSKKQTYDNYTAWFTAGCIEPNILF